MDRNSKKLAILLMKTESIAELYYFAKQLKLDNIEKLSASKLQG